MNDIRWKQRFENYEKAFGQLGRFLAKEDLNEFEEQGLIQCFEYTYELAWNVMKDYLVYQGFTGISGSRDAIRQAFNQGLISNGQVWMNMVDDRIKSVHSYDHKIVDRMERKIFGEYFHQFEQFYHKMKSLLS